MIIVDIFVPSMNKSYDFSLDENASVAAIIEEICEMIGQKEHSSISGDSSRLFLYRREGIRLEKKKQLCQLGVRTGQSLILV